MANIKKKTPVKKKISKQKAKAAVKKVMSDKKTAPLKKKAAKKTPKHKSVNNERSSEGTYNYGSLEWYLSEQSKKIESAMNKNEPKDSVKENESIPEPSPQPQPFVNELPEPVVQERDSQKIVLNIRNISRIEKRVSLFNAAYDDREIFIESEFEKQVSYKEIVSIIKQGEYDIMSAYLKITKGDFSSTLAYLGFGHTDKKVTGQINYTPLQLVFDAYQFQINVCQEFINGSLQLNAGNTIELNIQANTEIYLQILVSKV